MRELAVVPAVRKLAVAAAIEYEIGRQAAFDLGKVAGAGHAGLGILYPALRVIKRKVDIMLS